MVGVAEVAQGRELSVVIAVQTLLVRNNKYNKKNNRCLKSKSKSKSKPTITATTTTTEDGMV